MTRIKRIVVQHPLAAFFVVAAVVVRIVFWIYTERVWEDAYITITHARNLLDGIGLTHHVGEPPIHGFTSALSVLIPIVGELVDEPLLALRVASIAAAGGTIVLAYALGRRLGVESVPLAFVLGFLAFDQSQIFFGMAGMETQIAVLVLFASLYFLDRGAPVMAGISLGVSLLARPDFMLWIAAVAVVLLIRRDRALPISRIALAAGAVVAPWVLFATLYYGSPIPHSIEAKNLYPYSGLAYSPSLAEIRDYGLELWKPFSPFFQNVFVSSAPISQQVARAAALVFAAFAAWGLFAGGKRRAVQIMGVYVLLFLAYKLRLRPYTYFMWYMPPLTAVTAVLAGVGMTQLARLNRWIGLAVAAAMVVLFALHIPFSFPLERKVQNEIEYAVRTETGRALGRLTDSSDTVVLEPAGYLAYFAGDVTIYDYPGLTSEVATDALARVRMAERSTPRLAAELEPDWIVFRPAEFQQFTDSYAELATRYEVAMTIGGPPPDLSAGPLTYGTIDNEFLILRRVED